MVGQTPSVAKSALAGPPAIHRQKGCFNLSHSLKSGLLVERCDFPRYTVSNGRTRDFLHRHDALQALIRSRRTCFGQAICPVGNRIGTNENSQRLLEDCLRAHFVGHSGGTIDTAANRKDAL